MTEQVKETKELKEAFSLPVFEGPLELLLHLINKNEVNIYDIPISIIYFQMPIHITKFLTSHVHYFPHQMQ